MSDSLREQLLKAGLVTEQQARRAAHDQRVGRKQQGREGVEAERRARKQQVEAGKKAQRQADRAREAARRDQAVDRETEHRVRQIVASGKVERTRGPRRFYFETRDGRLPYLEVTDELGQRLERGGLGIAESPDGEVSLVEAEAAQRVAELAPGWLRVWQGRRA